MAARVLIVEDDRDIGDLLQMHIRGLGAEVRHETHGTRGMLLAQQSHWDLIVLDVRLPGTDGITVCRRIRALEHCVPIILLTAKTGEADRVEGLDSGADDYVAKPFSIVELLARVRAQLRRARLMRDAPGTLGASRAAPGMPIIVGHLFVDPAARVAVLGGRALKLTSREFALLAFFASHPGRAFTREQLLHAVWGAAYEGYEHTVNSHINRLRAKIEHDPANPRFISTVWGTGYRFDAAQLEGRA
ncbi:MAG: winged helix-turn-helix domain-containing protein [Steroidobacteraceae bacterium]